MFNIRPMERWYRVPSPIARQHTAGGGSVTISRRTESILTPVRTASPGRQENRRPAPFHSPTYMQSCMPGHLHPSAARAKHCSIIFKLYPPAVQQHPVLRRLRLQPRHRSLQQHPLRQQHPPRHLQRHLLRPPENRAVILRHLVNCVSSNKRPTNRYSRTKRRLIR